MLRQPVVCGLAVLSLLVPAGGAAAAQETPIAARDTTDRTEALADALQGGRARAVILLIGDGMGDSEITIARNYQLSPEGVLALDRLPLAGACTTHAVQEANPFLPDYVTDSAASSTAWATGRKTSNGRIATSPRTDRDLTTILELAQRAGLRTGLVTTSELTDSTPAALAAHVSSRSCHGPQDMATCPQDKKAAGGPGSIAEQMVDHGVDVLLGGGRARFEQAIDAGPFAGRTVLRSAALQGYNVVSNSASLMAAPAGALVLGLFNASNMSLEWGGLPAEPFPGTGPQRCTRGLRPANEPSLAAMTRKALELLDPGAGSPGFFLQVEGASIDKRDHAANPCEQIGETVAFDAAVAEVLEYAEQNPGTLVIVTADHAHTSQIVPNPTAEDHSPGAYSTLITGDGAQMTVNYATNLFGRSQEHTGAQVRVAARGPQAANVVGVIDHTDLFRIMRRALDL